MVLSPESRQADLTDSLKKYFLDTIETVSGIKIFFEWMDDTPVDDAGVKLDKWVIFDFGDSDLGAVSEILIFVHLFVRKDSEEYLLSRIQDTFMGYIIDEDSTNGLVSIPYYDTTASPWVQIGGILPFVKKIYGAQDGKDNTKIKTIQLLCKWGGK